MITTLQRTLFNIAVAVGVLSLIYVFNIIGETDPDLKTENHVPTSYYAQLIQECRKGDGANCCMASVKSMRIRDARIMPEQGCPSGFRKNMLKCPQSHTWCESVLSEKETK